jgi:GNAT superfamily N-acetyltransferase
MKLAVHPLTPARWPDLESIFAARGCSVARGCWCMCYRVSGEPPPRPPGVTQAAAARAAFKALVDAGVMTGLVGYRDGQPVGWVSLGPREDYAKLRRSPVMKGVDDEPVWSIVCFVVPAEHRGQGVATALLAGAVAWARAAGFEEVARRRPQRPIVRLRPA